ncbi:amiloride-sensitive sodium channel subunit alpha [Bombina bombina]|uniref:amiloride-sensitive sodium channel subunit alpha n=1 Tax=Bombina bombina TaxID=8345 RepID=UPI00235AE267|nr:amiloride-sensitive sodium channel subunit alpha [Bombina bombina]
MDMREKCHIHPLNTHVQPDKCISFLVVRVHNIAHGITSPSHQEEPKTPQTRMMAEEEKSQDEPLIGYFKSYRELFEFFCSNTTIHGAIRLVCSRNNRMKTAFWLVLFLATFGLMYWQFALLFGQYFSYPVSINVNVNSDRLPFPAVTICTLNPYSHWKSEQQATGRGLAIGSQSSQQQAQGWPLEVRGAAINRHRIGHWKSEEQPSTGKGLAIGSQCSQKQAQDWPLKVSAVRNRHRFGHWKLEEQPSTGTGLAIGSHCSQKQAQDWPLEVIAARNRHMIGYWKSVQSETGTGLATGSWRSSHQQAQDRPLEVSAVRNRHRIGHWKLKEPPSTGTGLAIGSNCSQKQAQDWPLEVIAARNRHRIDHWKSVQAETGTGFVVIRYFYLSGLTLVLRAEQNDYIPLLSTVAGARFVVHGQNESPFMDDRGFNIQPGVETSIGMKKETVQRLGGQYSDCSEDGSDVNVTNLYNSEYTQQVCVRSCFQAEMVLRCGCGYVFYPLPQGQEYCDIKKHKSWGHCYYKLSNEFATDELGCFTKCRKPCLVSDYQLTAGYARWPTAVSEDWVLHTLSQNQNNLTERNGIAKLNIYFEELNYKTTQESPTINMVMLLSLLGSQWSLWFGSSVLSVVEMGELVIDVVVIGIIILLQRHRRSQSQELEETCRVPTPESSFGEEDISQMQIAHNLTDRQLRVVADITPPPAYESLDLSSVGGGSSRASSMRSNMSHRRGSRAGRE